MLSPLSLPSPLYILHEVPSTPNFRPSPFCALPLPLSSSFPRALIFRSFSQRARLLLSSPAASSHHREGNEGPSLSRRSMAARCHFQCPRRRPAAPPPRRPAAAFPLLCVADPAGPGKQRPRGRGVDVGHCCSSPATVMSYCTASPFQQPKAFVFKLHLSIPAVLVLCRRGSKGGGRRC